jgi:hypothetical protein
VALVLRVGTTADVFTEPFAANLAAALEHHFGEGMSLRGQSEDEGWNSIELGSSWWRQLQERVGSLLGTEATPHFSSVPAWRGVFLPKDVEIGKLSEVPGDEAPICIASLPALMRELEAASTAMGVPFTIPECESMAAKYDDDELCDDDPELQALLQLVIGAHRAVQRNQPLWVIK